ncbi:phosphate ABC transporter membrane protein 2, PhoT family (TC 3.A.1.7.1) [Clostridium cavendishii DSM 21758]|uniref:Phosphate transport system permease protein PstA n=1 Tax=Clostridium cavendishii DSM 21758 TaxID=1121302 RepID=A0A1M6KC50_9CLOT|nr:phosphate ABC transporter permease PstA [Clostridium cavendishii]SHJ56482.1 phosphate ABC transporter membrane protein 2, PhoT family (TC 3.A.1.7.1) [Clostridium cavendishii DSM 21758]
MNAKKVDKVATIILYLIAGFVVALLGIFIIYILYRGRNNIFDFNFIFGSQKLGEAGGGIGMQLFNSFYMLLVSLIITIPIGLGAGIFLAEYAKEGKIVRFIRLCIETMAALPSIVVGLFGLLIFVTMFKLGYSILAGALSVSILNLPALTRVSENAIRESSKKVKEASLGLGATKWQTIKKVILPSAMPQILTGIILAAGRIFGEAAAFLYTAGMTGNLYKFDAFSLTDKVSSFSLFRPAETLAVHIWKVNSESSSPDAFQIANGTSAVLIIVVLLFNITARLLGNKLYKAYSGK